MKVYINARGRAKAIWRWRGVFVQVITPTLLQRKSCSTNKEMLSCEWHIREGLTSRCWCGMVKRRQGCVIISPGRTTGAAVSMVLSCRQPLALLGWDFGSLSWSLLCLYQYVPPVGARRAHVFLQDPAPAAGTGAMWHRAALLFGRCCSPSWYLEMCLKNPDLMGLKLPDDSGRTEGKG